MKIKNLFNSILLTTMVACFSAGCTDDLYDKSSEENPPGVYPLKALISFGDGFTPHTRLGINSDDGWSYSRSSFQAGDKVGVFSRAGNMNIDNGNGPIINIPMTYTLVSTTDAASGGEATETYTFMNNDVKIYTEAMRYNGVFMYFPYFDEMGKYPDNYVIANPNKPITEQYYTMDTEPGVPLRVRTGNGKWDFRCRDMLQMARVDAPDLQKGVLKGDVYHTFAEIGIVRGVGFDNPPKGQEDIFVVMTEPYTHVRVVSNPNTVGWIIQLVSFDDDYDKNPWAKQYANETGLSKDEFKRWKCWEGSAPNGVEVDGEVPKYYYALVPTTSYGPSDPTNVSYRSTVQEIYLADNDGHWQHVTSFNLNTNGQTTSKDEPNYESSEQSNGSGIPDKNPRYYNRYFLEIQMSELGPTVSPVNIDKWVEAVPGEVNDITEVRNYGINNVEQYNDWVLYYNAYQKNKNDDELKNQLKYYGDYDITNGIWHFYINKDLIFIPGNPEFTPSTVDVLTDILEGANQFANMTLSGISVSKPLFTEISGHGGIRNLDFDGITVKNNTTESIGSLAGSVTGSAPMGSGPGITADGMFYNCNIINGTVIGNGPVGILAGTMTSGLISGCSFSGFIMGDSTSGSEVIEGTALPMTAKILGETPASNPPSIMNTDSNDIIFSEM